MNSTVSTSVAYAQGRSIARSSAQLLPARRLALIARIHDARTETANVGRRVVADLHATAKTRHAIHNGWKLLKASAVAAGVIWSFKATTGYGRGRRFFTVAVSLLSTLRALKNVRALLLPPA